MSHPADHYRQQLKALLPPGRAFSRETNTDIHRLLDGVAQEFARIDARGDDLLIEAIPTTCIELLPDWERVLGLPDGCLPRDGSIVARRQAVLAKLNAIGGQTAVYYIGLADSLGYPGARVEEFHPFTANSECIDFLYSDPWCFVWILHVPQLPPGNAASDRALECLIARYRPAHTHVIVRYSDHLYVYTGFVEPGYLEGDPQ